MTRRALVPLAYFGKLKSRGDFVRSTSQPTLIRTLDDWLSQGIELMSADPRWKEVYDRSPSAHFAFFSASSQRAIAGHLAASADASGRRFPFVVAGAFDVAEPLAFLPCAPMALARLWARFEQSAQNACATEDATVLLAEIAQVEVELDVEAGAYEASMRDFIELQTMASLEGMLRGTGHQIDLRQALLAIGLLLQPVLGSTGVSLKKGLRLPLPADPLYRPLVASFWLELIVPFLRRLDLEIALFLPRRGGAPAQALAIGFSGGSAAHLHAVLDADVAAEAFIDPSPAEWVEDQVRQDYAVTKLSSYLAQPQLSLRQAMATFRETFLGE